MTQEMSGFNSLSLADDVEGFIGKLLAPKTDPEGAGLTDEVIGVLKQVFQMPLAKQLLLHLADSLFLQSAATEPHAADVDVMGLFRNRQPAAPGAPAAPRVPLSQRPAFQFLWKNKDALINAGLTLAGLFGLKLPPGLATTVGGLLGGLVPVAGAPAAGTAPSTPGTATPIAGTT